MRTVLISSLGLLLATGSVWGQSNFDYRDRDRDSGRDRGYSASDRGTFDDSDYNADRSSRRSWTGDRASNDHDDHDQHHHHHSKGYGGGGARFYLKAGDREFRVRCGDDDSTRECVDAALTMFRAVQDSTRSTSLSPGTPGGSATSPQTSPGSGTTGGSATGR